MASKSHVATHRMAIPPTTRTATAAHAGSATETISISPESLRAGIERLGFSGDECHGRRCRFSVSAPAGGSSIGDRARWAFCCSPRRASSTVKALWGSCPHAEVDVPRGFFDAAFDVTLVGGHARCDADLHDRWQHALAHQRHRGRSRTTKPPWRKRHVNVTTTTTLRVLVLKDRYADAPVVTHSYLFLDDVIRQPAQPAGMPTQLGRRVGGLRDGSRRGRRSRVSRADHPGPA